MKKSILLFILVSLFTCSFAANPVVTVNEAKQTAANFLNEQCYINAESCGALNGVYESGAVVVEVIDGFGIETLIQLGEGQKVLTGEERPHPG